MCGVRVVRSFVLDVRGIVLQMWLRGASDLESSLCVAFSSDIALSRIGRTRKSKV